MTFKAPLDLTVHAPDGMYDPANEHDACGVGMVTTLNKRPERKIVTDAIEVLVNLDHRGAVGAEENTGDGAGILMSMPDEFMRATVPAELPEAGHYAAGIAFLDRDIETSGQQEQAIAKIVREEGLEVLAWRVVPTNPDGLGLQAQRRPGLDGRAQHIACGNLRNAVFLADKGSLRAFSGAGGAQQDQFHGRMLLKQGLLFGRIPCRIAIA